MLASVFRRILTDGYPDEWGIGGYVSLNDEHGIPGRRPYLTLDLSTGQLEEDEYAVIKRVMEGDDG